MQDLNPYTAPQASPQDQPSAYPQYHLAGKGSRILGFVVDMVVIRIIFVFVAVALAAFFRGDNLNDSRIGTVIMLVFVTTFVLYYEIMEGSCGRTVGKFVTGTKVVRPDGSPISWGQALARSVTRFIPFDWLSIFMGDLAWHDSIPKTQVVTVRGPNALKKDMPIGRAPVRPPMPGQPLPPGVVPGPARPGVPNRPPAPPQQQRPPVNPQ